MSRASLGWLWETCFPSLALECQRSISAPGAFPSQLSRGEYRAEVGTVFLDTQESSSWRPVAFRPGGGPLWRCLGHREAGVHWEGKAKRRPILGGVDSASPTFGQLFYQFCRVDLHRRIPLRKIWPLVGVRPQALKLEAWILV